VRRLMAGRRTAGSAAIWSTFGTASEFVATFIALLVTSRLVSPRQFGIYAGWLAVGSIASEATSAGLRYRGVLGAVRRHASLRTVVARSVVTGVITITLGVGAAIFLGRADDIPVVVALSSMVPLRNTYALIEGQLQVRLRFRFLGLVQALGGLTYLGVSLVLAAAWRNALALSVAQLSLYLVPAVAFLSGPGVRRLHDIDARVESLPQNDIALSSGLSLQNALLTQADSLIVGARIGASELGLYTRAFRLSVMPARLFSDAIGSVLVPLFVHRSKDAGARRLLDIADAAVLVLVLPVTVPLAVYSDEIIALTLGDRWRDAAPVMSILVVTVGTQIQMKFLQSATIAKGEFAVLLRNSFIRLLLFVSAGLVAAEWGITGVAASLALAIVVGYFRLRWIEQDTHSVRARHFLVSQVGLTAVLVGIGYAIRAATQPWFVGAGVLLGVSFALAGLTGMRLLGEKLRSSLAIESLPGPLARVYGFSTNPAGTRR
jgi:O-antigen/teichoic acid export membrane protein